MGKKMHSTSPGFEDKLWAVPDRLRCNKSTAEYKYVVLSLICLKNFAKEMG